MKPKVTKTPNGKVQVAVTVTPRRSAALPMNVGIDLDAIRAAIARMDNPPCDPDTAVKIVKQQIADDEPSRLYTAMLDEYATIFPNETKGDALGFIEMEFLAFRQIMDDEVPDFRPDIHEDVLSAALSFKVDMRLPIAPMRGKKRIPAFSLSIPTPLVRKRNDALAAIQLAVLSAASRARRIGSDSYRTWRDALEVLARREFTADGAMRREDIKRLVSCLRSANMTLFLDAAVAAYQPLSHDDPETKEADDVL